MSDGMTGPADRIRTEVASWDGIEMRPHHVLPDTGWVTAPIGGPEDVGRVIELFRLSYDRALDARRHRRAAETRDV